MNQIYGDQFEAQAPTSNREPLIARREAFWESDRHFAQADAAVFDVWKSGPVFAYVVTVCDESSAEKCPIFPGPTRRLHWSFPDPSTLTGTHAEKLAAVREIRDEIRARIEAWCDEVCSPVGL